MMGQRFKVGDKVRYVGKTTNLPFKSRTFTVCGVRKDTFEIIDHCENETLVEWNNRAHEWELVEEDYTPEDIQDIAEFMNDSLESIEDEGGNRGIKIKGEYCQEDPVNSPSHYGQGAIEAIEYIEDFLTEEEYIGYLRGNITKYMHRWRYKNGVEDLKKAQWYLNKLIETQE